MYWRSFGIYQKRHLKIQVNFFSDIELRIKGFVSMELLTLFFHHTEKKLKGCFIMLMIAT